jgi:hypothetical protein
MAVRKKQTQTFLYYNYGNKKKKKPTLTTYCTYDNTKKWIAIEFFLLAM